MQVGECYVENETAVTAGDSPSLAAHCYIWDAICTVFYHPNYDLSRCLAAFRETEHNYCEEIYLQAIKQAVASVGSHILSNEIVAGVKITIYLYSTTTVKSL